MPELETGATKLDVGDIAAGDANTATYFTVHGSIFGSIEAFAQTIKLKPNDPRVASVAIMTREEAIAFRDTLNAENNNQQPTFVYWGGEPIPFGSEPHNSLMSFAARQYGISLGKMPNAKSLIANVVSTSNHYANISNFALTPFAIDGQKFASVESFIQYIKYSPRDQRRVVVPELYGVDAKRAGRLINKEIYHLLESRQHVNVFWKDQVITYRSEEHQALIKRALTEKFNQSETARSELLSTVNRLTGEEKQIVHKTRRENPNTSLTSIEFSSMLTVIRKQILAQNKT
jgi:predicted NAD-dependent protein-ADP-ribosyltransferase YbiA (DUF1768 family)